MTTTQPPRLRLRLSGLLLACLAFGALPSPCAHAEEGAAAVDTSVIGPTTEMKDRENLVAVDLPNTWTVDRDISGPGLLIAFRGPLAEGEGAPGGLFYVQRRDGSIRASMVVEDLVPTGAEVRDGSRSSGDGWAQLCVAKDGAADWYRAVEHQGRVILFVLRTPDAAFAQTEAFAKAMLTGTRVIGDLEWGAAPEDWKSKEKKGVLYTHEPDAVKLGVDEVTDMFDDVRKALEDLLDEDPYDRRPPELRMFQSGAAYEEACTPHLGAAPDDAAYVPQERAVFAKLMSYEANGFIETVATRTAQQYVHQYFGGSVPYWIRTGLVFYGRNGGLNGGDGDKYEKEWIENVVPRIQGSRALNEWFGTEQKNVTDENAAALELWAWTYFLTHGKAPSKARKAFARYLEDLWKTGDTNAALEAFDGIDHRELHADFKKWGGKLK